MKSIFTLAALAGLTQSLKINSEYHYPKPRRLDTNLVAFVTQDDNAFNDELYKHNNVTKLGDHGFLIDGSKLDFSGWHRKIEGPEEVKALVRIISADGEEEEKARENEEDPGKAGRDAENSE